MCASKGSSSAAIAARVLPKSQVLSFQDVASCYLGLQNEKVDGFTAGELILKRFELDSQKAGTPTVLLPEPTYVEHIGVVVNKGNPGLLAAINKVIQEHRQGRHPERHVRQVAGRGVDLQADPQLQGRTGRRRVGRLQASCTSISLS